MDTFSDRRINNSRHRAALEETTALELAYACEVPGPVRDEFRAWCLEQFGGHERAGRIISIYLLGRLWVDGQRANETDIWEDELNERIRGRE